MCKGKGHGFILGVILGGLIGAVTALLFAPRLLFQPPPPKLDLESTTH